VFVYDTYEVGKVYGTDEFRVTRACVRDWLAMYPGEADGEVMPPGLVVLIQQQAYKRIVTPRPPGHIQGRQRFQLHLLPVGETVIHTAVACLSKEIRKERRWVEMGFRGLTAAGALVYTGINTVLVPC
jgi:hypothetical protein